MRTRAERRAARDRMKARALKIGRRLMLRFAPPDTPNPYRFLYDTRSPCSLSCCGNPRRWVHGEERFTIQERRFVAEALTPADRSR